MTGKEVIVAFEEKLFWSWNKRNSLGVIYDNVMVKIIFENYILLALAGLIRKLNFVENK